MEWFGQSMLVPYPLQSIVWTGPVLSSMMIYHYDTVKVILGSKGTPVSLPVKLLYHTNPHILH